MVQLYFLIVNINCHIHTNQRELFSGLHFVQCLLFSECAFCLLSPIYVNFSPEPAFRSFQAHLLFGLGKYKASKSVLCKFSSSLGFATVPFSNSFFVVKGNRNHCFIKAFKVKLVIITMLT